MMETTTHTHIYTYGHIRATKARQGNFTYTSVCAHRHREKGPRVLNMMITF